MRGLRLTTACAFCATTLAATCAPEMCTGQGASSCPAPDPAMVSKPPIDSEASLQNVYFRNAAPFTAELLRVAQDGEEVSHGFLSSSLRRGLPTTIGDVWRARAVRPGQPGDRRLLLQHRIGSVPLKDCDCPQPAFVDCAKPPFAGPRTGPIDDPVVFQNQAQLPVDLFYWNGTCEELVSWQDVGGVQPLASKRLLSTQGHSFRVRAAGDRRMLMQHTLNDLVIRGCEEDARKERDGDAEQLSLEVAALEGERNRLREALAAQLSRLLVAVQHAAGNATAGAATSLLAVDAMGTAGPAAPSLLSPLLVGAK